MARRQQVIHINSNVKGKLPTGSTESVVDYGEIAVNYNETDPFLSILKNGKTGTSNADFAKFSADEVLEKLFDEKYATIEEIEKNEETISGALNELNEKVESIEDLVLDFTLLPQKNPVVGSDGNQTASYTADEVQLGITNGMTYAEFFQAILSGKDVIIKNTIEDGIIEHLRPFKCGHIKNVNGYNAVVFVYSYIYDLDDHRDTEFIIMMSYDETGMVWADSARLLATHESVRPLKIGDKEYKVFNEVTITAADLGLGKVLKYCGVTTTELEDGSTATTVVIDGKNHTAEPGCVVFRDITENGNTVTQEFVYNGSKWELLGKDLTYKVIQDQIDSPTTDGSDIAFIDTISQNANGVITATKKNVRSATTGQTGVVKLTNSTTSTSTSLAATAKAVKTAFDKGAEALTAANGKWTAVDATTSVKGIVTLKEGDLSGVTATTSGVAASSYHTHSQYLTSHQDISHLATKQEVDDNEEVTSNALNVLNASISELEQSIEDNNALVLDLSLIGGIKSNLTSSELEIGFGGKRTYEEIFQEIANGKQVVLKYNNGFGTQILYPNTWFDGNGYVFIYNDIPSFTSFEVNNRVMVLAFTSDGCSMVNNELWVSRTGHTHDNYLTKTDGTVVKTTPQTLSDTDKNQVKENLGLHDAMLNVTYLELKSLRDNSQLIPGQQYRITDYVTTTVQEKTRIAEEYHQFDIIVIADDVNVLNENARAIQHDGDTYFSNSDLNAWELKYCLDNDTSRFIWADNSNNGKGVIYYMKDEWNNECPYDFKNIQFARWELSSPVGYRNDYDYVNYGGDNWIQESTPFDSLKTGFYGLNGSDNVFTYGYDDEHSYDRYRVEYTISESPTYCYTFGKDADYSINGSNYDNVINEYNSGNKIQLNNIVFLGDNCNFNSFGNGCISNSFGNGCISNSFGNYCNSNSFGNYCQSNSFGNNCNFNSFGNYCNSNSFDNNCYSNSFGNNCISNSFDNNCYSNSFGNNCNFNSFGNAYYSNGFGNSCSNNSFGNYCYSNGFGNSCSNNSFVNGYFDNTLGNNCVSNSFGNNCQSNSFGNNCNFNSFGEYCNSNSFGNYCYYNSFGNDCISNTFGNYCLSNSFGNYCQSNSFGESCDSNTFGNSCKSNFFGSYCHYNRFGEYCIFNTFGESRDNLKSHYQYIIFDNGNRYINLNCTSTTSSVQYFQNVRIGLGVNYAIAYKTINDSNVGQTYETLYKSANSQTITV